MRVVGSRVGALRSATPENGVELYGYGVYEGDKPCPYLGDRPNPSILLDDGRRLWGCECWWGPEPKMQEMISDWVKAGYTLIEVLG